MSTLIPDALLERLGRVRSMGVLTGAGISAESGIQTFREAQTGIWARWHPEDLATPQAFLRNPKLVWEWYRWRRKLVADALPNPGHLALASMERCVDVFHVATQNVDGLHRKAGSRNVVELHGDLFANICSVDRGLVEVPDDSDGPPPCPRCGAPVRPGVVWFGESLPEKAYRDACDLASGCEIYLVVGTSALVHPAAGLPMIAKASGACLVEINPDPTPLSGLMDHCLRLEAGKALPALLAAMP